MNFQVKHGKPMAYGAVLTEDGVNFSLFSRNATRVVLNLFDSPEAAKPASSVELDPRQNRTGDIWHVCLKGLGEGALYLYQVDGPYEPTRGHRFNFNRHLIDPFAKALTRGSVFNSFRNQFNASILAAKNISSAGDFDLTEFPKCVVVGDDFDWQDDRPLNRPLSDTIIYETHLKGFTASKTSGVEHPGTYLGLTEKIGYLKQLGITAVELLPIFEFDENENDRINPRTGEKLKNFWGYSTFGFFAPKASYAADQRPGGVVREFKTMVRELHKAGLEVILDVVYNHTAEGNEHGPTFVFKGIENSIYYMLPQSEKQYYMNYSGCGNTLNANHPIVIEFILQSLRYWVTEMHVDGFRFDLGSALTRDEYGNVLGNPPLTIAIAEDPLLRNAKIIAEPWDAGGAYHVGHFPGSRWCEWNGLFRDDMRRFVRGDEHTATGAATRIAGSSDLYRESGRSPQSSINFITCHDGFTLNDLVCYNYKHNDENGEGNRDGSDDNLSYNYGFEGASTNKKITSARLRHAKNFMLCLLVSQGTPMILSGDEVLRTQGGNNNAYCQDSDISYFNWNNIEENRDFLHFTQTLIEFRKKHRMFRLPDFLTGREIAWHNSLAQTPDWRKINRFLAFQLIGNKEERDENDYYVAINNDIYDLTLTLPSPPDGSLWHRIADTSIEGLDDIREESNEEALVPNTPYVLVANSAILLMSKKS